MFNPLASHQMESLESRKLLAAGSLDNSYVSPFDGQSNFAMSSDRIVIQKDGKSVLAGSNGIDAVVYRVTKNGRIDKNFGSHGATIVPHHGRATYVLGEVAVRPSDNRIIAVGEQNLGSIASARYAVGKDWAV